MKLRKDEAIAKLIALAERQSNGASLLRIYWYDGLVGGQRTSEQVALAGTENVKIRLGTVTAGMQKGVDSLIVTDLIELARNRAISDAVLLSGDEDLRIGVQIAQGFGVRVHLIGIEPRGGNQSSPLREEADTTIEWRRQDIQEILSAELQNHSTLHTPASLAPTSTIAEDSLATLRSVITQLVSAFDANELKSVADTLSQDPYFVPREYDIRLLASGRAGLGRDLVGAEKRLVRQVFRELVHASTPAP